MSGQFRNMCFTVNNYEDVEKHEAIFTLWPAVSYWVFGEEVGDSGTPHLQGYCEFKYPTKFSTVKKKLPTAHIEERIGTAKDASNYCKKGEQSKTEWKQWKDGGPHFGLNAKVHEGGEISNQGKRNDLSPAVEMIREGKRMRTVAQECPETFVRFHKGLIALQAQLVEPRTGPPTVKVFYGSTGSGKSKLAREWLGEDFYDWWPAQEKWFDGYEGEKNVIFEEFRGQFPFGMMLMLLDRYSARVQLKGSMINFAATRIAITSPLHPRLWYKSEELQANDRIDQMIRRIGGEECIYNLDWPGVKEEVEMEISPTLTFV